MACQSIYFGEKSFSIFCHFISRLGREEPYYIFFDLYSHYATAEFPKLRAHFVIWYRKRARGIKNEH